MIYLEKSDKMEKELNKDYWNNRYKEQNVPWDAGEITRPIKEYFDSLETKTVRILIPGCGSAHEAKYLHNIGFKNVTLCDWAREPLSKFSIQNPAFPSENLICGDFFNLKGQFDIIVEQTFFCAINPTLRKNYVNQVHNLLNNKGKLIGLMFNQQFSSGPPFGGNEAEYRSLFSEKFNINRMELCENSIRPRMGSELFIELIKR